MTALEQVRFVNKMALTAIKVKKMKTTGGGETKVASSSALAKLKRFVRAKRKVKVHPIVADDEWER